MTAPQFQGRLGNTWALRVFQPVVRVVGPNLLSWAGGLSLSGFGFRSTTFSPLHPAAQTRFDLMCRHLQQNKTTPTSALGQSAAWNEGRWAVARNLPQLLPGQQDAHGWMSLLMKLPLCPRISHEADIPDKLDEWEVNVPRDAHGD